MTSSRRMARSNLDMASILVYKTNLYTCHTLLLCYIAYVSVSYRRFQENVWQQSSS